MRVLLRIEDPTTGLGPYTNSAGCSLTALAHDYASYAENRPSIFRELEGIDSKFTLDFKFAFASSFQMRSWFDAAFVRIFLVKNNYNLAIVHVKHEDCIVSPKQAMYRNEVFKKLRPLSIHDFDDSAVFL